MTFNQRKSNLEEKLTVKVNQRDELLRQLDHGVNFDKIRAMPPKRARNVLKLVRKENEQKFKTVRKLNDSIARLEYRLYELRVIGGEL